MWASDMLLLSSDLTTQCSPVVVCLALYGLVLPDSSCTYLRSFICGPPATDRATFAFASAAAAANSSGSTPRPMLSHLFFSTLSKAAFPCFQSLFASPVVIAKVLRSAQCWASCMGSNTCISAIMSLMIDALIAPLVGTVFPIGNWAASHELIALGEVGILKGRTGAGLAVSNPVPSILSHSCLSMAISFFFPSSGDCAPKNSSSAKFIRLPQYSGFLAPAPGRPFISSTISSTITNLLFPPPPPCTTFH